MHDYIILRRNAWRDDADLERAASRSSRVGNEEMAERVRWIRSYIYREEDGTLGSACIYQATNADAVVEHARRANLECTVVLPIARTVVIREDAAVEPAQEGS